MHIYLYICIFYTCINELYIYTTILYCIYTLYILHYIYTLNIYNIYIYTLYIYTYYIYIYTHHNIYIYIDIVCIYICNYMINMINVDWHMFNIGCDVVFNQRKLGDWGAKSSGEGTTWYHSVGGDAPRFCRFLMRSGGFFRFFLKSMVIFHGILWIVIGFTGIHGIFTKPAGWWLDNYTTQ